MALIARFPPARARRLSHAARADRRAMLLRHTASRIRRGLGTAVHRRAQHAAGECVGAGLRQRPADGARGRRARQRLPRPGRRSHRAVPRPGRAPRDPPRRHDPHRRRGPQHRSPRRRRRAEHRRQRRNIRCVDRRRRAASTGGSRRRERRRRRCVARAAGPGRGADMGIDHDGLPRLRRKSSRSRCR